MENNELDLVAVRLIRERTYYNDKPLDSPEAVVDFIHKELSAYGNNSKYSVTQRQQ